MSGAPKTVWVTKYALTSGIAECEARGGDLGSKLFVPSPRNPNFEELVGPDDWHPTREAALVRAEEMRAAKIDSLRRQIAKLEALTF